MTLTNKRAHFTAMILLLVLAMTQSSPGALNIQKIFNDIPEIIKPQEKQEPKVLPYHGYLDEVGPTELRFETSTLAPISRHQLIPQSSPMTKKEKAMVHEEMKTKKAEGLIDLLIEKSFSLGKQMNEKKEEPVKTTAVATETVPPAPEPAAEPEEQSYIEDEYDDFVNPENILLYFEKQTEENDGETQKAIVPLTIPINPPTQEGTRSSATFEQTDN